MDTDFASFKHIFLVVIGLLPIMNPLAAAPLFLSLTSSTSDAFRRQQALKASVYATGILVAFLLLGNIIIATFGISMPGIRVAGGLIVIVLAFRMLFSEDEDLYAFKGGADAMMRAEVDVSFSPLAMPSLAGPGAIAVVMGYGSQIPLGEAVQGNFVVLAGIFITGMITWCTLLGANWVSTYLGVHGIQAVTKIMGFLLACIAVQFIASGARDFIQAMS